MDLNDNERQWHGMDDVIIAICKNHGTFGSGIYFSLEEM